MSNERTPLIQHPNGVDRASLRHELKTVFIFTIPIMGAQLLEYSLQVASIISIGHISTTALAAATLGSMTANVTAFSIIQGICSALDTLLPSAWTSSHPNLVGLWSQRMSLVVLIMLLPIYAIWFSAEAILLALKQDPEIAHLAALFLKYLSIGLPGYACNYITRRYFQAQGRFAIPAGILLVVALLNILLNYLLVWGPAPLGMGFVGAPLATGLSFDLIAILSLIAAVYIHLRDTRYNARLIAERISTESSRSDPQHQTHPHVHTNGNGHAHASENGHAQVQENKSQETEFIDRHGFRKIAWRPIDKKCLTDYKVLVRLGVSGIGQLAAVWWCWELVGLAASFLGAASLAAQSVLLISSSTTYQIPVSLSIAAAVRIGNLLGTENARAAKFASDAALLMGAIYAAITSTMFIVLRNQWAYIFNSDPEVVDLVASVLPLVAAFQFVDALSEVAGGILRAMGKQVRFNPHLPLGVET